MNFERPNPDQLLNLINQEQERSKKGKLKIFFGSSAGVGKTFAMLSEAQQYLRDNVDVVVGVVEHHGRTETQNLIEGLPSIPLLEIKHRDIAIKEFDIDAALARKPQLILIDELAHTNAPGSRHPKRWNDVEELLDNGIDVFTTLNVQHLESLNNLVEEITGIEVKETIPDSIFDKAEELELVDVSAEELLKRLKEGKVYLDATAKKRAAENFFKKSNLFALREIALRRTAERVDAQRDAYKIREGISDSTPVLDKILVCVGPDPLSPKLVRSAKRMATSLKAQWVAVYIENKRHFELSKEALASLESVMQIAQSNGAKTATLQGENAVDEIMNYARSNGITKIILGKLNKPRWKEMLNGTLAEKVIRRSGDIDVYVISGEVDKEKKPEPVKAKKEFEFVPYLVSFSSVFLCTIISALLDPYFKLVDIIMIYLIGVVALAATFGRGPSALFSIISVLAINWFFIEPRHTFTMYDSSNWTTLTVMLLTSLVISALAAKLRLQATFSRKKEKETEGLYALAREMSSIRGYENIAEAAVKHIDNIFNVSSTIWLVDEQGELNDIGGVAPDYEIKEKSVLEWCRNNGKPAGRSTNTMPSSSRLYMPLTSIEQQSFGVLGILPEKDEENFLPDDIALLETYTAIISAAFGRANAADNAERSKVETETVKLKNVLLSSVSHDLRTPLASISGAASSLITMQDRNSKDGSDLLKSVHTQTARLSKLVTNLLDVTSLESGNINLNKQPYFIDELIGSCLLRVEELKGDRHINVLVEPELPLINVDGILIEQVITNLLENAIRFAPETDGVIEIEVNKSGDEIFFATRDNGPGIKKGDEKKIFDKFYTSANIGSQNTGLGLTICRGIILTHKGRIWAENNKEGGAKFTFTLPVLKESEINE
jgi:two-component system sensor histidine kinase KdpD